MNKSYSWQRFQLDHNFINIVIRNDRTVFNTYQLSSNLRILSFRLTIFSSQRSVQSSSSGKRNRDYPRLSEMCFGQVICSTRWKIHLTNPYFRTKLVAIVQNGFLYSHFHGVKTVLMVVRIPGINEPTFLPWLSNNLWTNPASGWS